jgi:hypothetical protein
MREQVLGSLAAALMLVTACSQSTAPTGSAAPQPPPPPKDSTAKDSTHSTASDVTNLIAALGGDTAVLAIYDVRYNVTRVAGHVTTWDDARGTGYGPALVPTQVGAKYQPLYNGSYGPILFSQTDSNALRTALPSPLFDLSKPLTLVYVGSVTKATSGLGSVAIASDSIDPPARVLALASKGYPRIFAIAGAYRSISLDTNVPTSGIGVMSDTLRMIVVSNDGLNISAQVDNAFDTVEVNGCGQHDGFCGTASGPGPNYLTIGAMFSSPPTEILPGSPLVNDVIILNRVLTPADYVKLSCWAIQYRGVQAVGTAPPCH